MAHARQQIRDAAYTGLVIAATSAGSNVFRERVYPHEKAKLPSLAIYTTLEEIADDFDTTGGQLRRFLNLVVEARVAGLSSSFPENALDDLCAEVEEFFGTYPTLDYLGSGTDLVEWVRLSSTETELDGEQEKVVGLATMTFRVTYGTPASDPTTIIG